MFPADFGYVRARSVDHALAELAAEPDAKLLAGGQSLLPMMKLRLAVPEALIDIGGLCSGTVVDGAATRIGATTTYRALLADRPLLAAHPALADALVMLADPQVRARGTVGGALAHADPAADLPAVLLALGATVSITGPRGSRAVPLEGFTRGAFTTGLTDDEILTAVTLPAHAAGQAYEKFEQPASGLPLAGVCAAVTAEGGVRLAVTGVTTRPYLAAATELVTQLPAGLHPLSDQHASGEFRVHLARVLAERALSRARERARS